MCVLLLFGIGSAAAQMKSKQQQKNAYLQNKKLPLTWFECIKIHITSSASQAPVQERRWQQPSKCFFFGGVPKQLGRGI